MERFDPSDFLQRCFSTLERDGVDVSHLDLDHLCYRVEQLDRYVEMKSFLLQRAALLGEHRIGGRPIATFRLHTPFQFRGRGIDVVELPAPKQGSPYREGFEHIEFVVDEDPLDFAARYPKLVWDLSGAHKSINADVRLAYEGFSVKFHERSLANVIADEAST